MAYIVPMHVKPKFTYLLTCETNTRTSQEIPTPDKSWRSCNYNPTSNWPHQSHEVPYIVLRTTDNLQTLTVEHMLLECTVLQQNCDEYYNVDSLGTLFETIPEACIIEFLREAGFFYLIWMAIYPEQPLSQISHQATRFWTWFNPSNTTRFCNLFIELNQFELWENPTCERRLICPGGHVSSLNKCNPIHYNKYLGHQSLKFSLKVTCLKFHSNLSGSMS